MRLRNMLACLLTVATCLAASPVHASWPSDPSVNLPLSSKATSKFDMASTPDGNGGAFVVWVEASSSYDVWAQHVSATGQLLWGSNGVQVTSNSLTNETSPNIVPDGLGGAWVAWQVNTNGNDIYAQHLTAAGGLVSGVGGILVCNDPGNQALWNISTYLVPMVADGYGGVYIAWWDNRNTNSDVFLQRIYSSGTQLLGLSGLAIGYGPGNQTNPAMTSDGAGGVYLAWQDDRNGNQDLYGQHVTASSAIASTATWNASGTALITATLDQTAPVVTGDGSGGFHMAWLDARSGTNTAIYASRFSSAPASFYGALPVCNATGTRSRLAIAGDGAGGTLYYWYDGRVSPNPYYVQRANPQGTMLWTTDGVSVSSTFSSPAFIPTVTPDGAGGALVTFNSTLGSFEQIYANHVSSAGAVLWGTGGTLLRYNIGTSYRPMGVSDGNGGLIATWFDGRGGNAYSQRIDRYGYLGSPEPEVVSVRDVVGDQGGKVKVTWNASYRDADGVFGVAEYRLWRSAPARAAATASMRGRLVSTDPDQAAAHNGIYAAQGYAWELATSQVATQLPQYSLVAATTTDSMSAGNPRTVFMVEARAGSALSAQHWFSQPDSGYSVDNVAPLAPAPFTGAYSAGSATMHWRANTETDLAGYRLYRGGTASFPLDVAHRVAELSDTAFVDAAGAPAYYRLTAVDAHGNESPATSLMPLGTTDVSDAGRALALAAPAPNPLRARATSQLTFTLPSAQRVTLTIFDAAGRPVRTLADGLQSAGVHTIPFDGLGTNGSHLAAGLYFVRLDAGGQRLTRRLALLD